MRMKLSYLVAEKGNWRWDVHIKHDLNPQIPQRILLPSSFYLIFLSNFLLYIFLHYQLNKMGNEHAFGNGNTVNNDGAAGMQKLTQVPTSVTLSGEQFEMLYLNPLRRRQPEMTKKLGNPTPLYVFPYSLLLLWDMRHLMRTSRGLGAFILTATPLSCCLMGWRGAGGEGVAFT